MNRRVKLHPFKVLKLYTYIILLYFYCILYTIRVTILILQVLKCLRVGDYRLLRRCLRRARFRRSLTESTGDLQFSEFSFSQN